MTGEQFCPHCGHTITIVTSANTGGGGGARSPSGGGVGTATLGQGGGHGGSGGVRVVSYSDNTPKPFPPHDGQGPDVDPATGDERETTEGPAAE